MPLESEAKKFLGQFDSDGESQKAETAIACTDSLGEAEDKTLNFQTRDCAAEASESKADTMQAVSDMADESEETVGSSELAKKFLAVSEELKKSTAAQRDLEMKVIQTLNYSSA